MIASDDSGGSRTWKRRRQTRQGGVRSDLREHTIHLNIRSGQGTGISGTASSGLVRAEEGRTDHGGNLRHVSSLAKLIEPLPQLDVRASTAATMGRCLRRKHPRLLLKIVSKN